MARRIVLCGWLRLHNCSVSQLVTRQSGCYQLHIMAGCVICRAIFEKKTGGYGRKSFVSLLRKCSILVREALNLLAPSLFASLPLGGLKETKNVSSPSTCESQYCGEPPWPRGSVLGLRPPGLEFRILCLEDSVISIISPSSGGSPGPV